LVFVISRMRGSELSAFEQRAVQLLEVAHEDCRA
jgi:hypothetical protein